jgi:hypothetical protein
LLIKVFIVALIGLLLIFDVSVPWLRMRPSFRSPYLPDGVAESTWERGHRKRLAILFEGDIHLLGYKAPTHTLYPGDPLEITLYWRAEDETNGDNTRKNGPKPYTVWSQFGPQDPTRYVVGSDRWLGGTLYPNTLWRSGDTVRQIIRLRLPAWTPTPALYWLRLGLVNEQGARLITTTGEDHVTLGPWRVRATAPPPPLEHQVDFHVGDISAQGAKLHRRATQGEVQLIGYALDSPRSLDNPKNVALTETLVVTLAWKSHATVETDYVVFVHLLDDRGELIAQHDGPPARRIGITYPPSWWVPGDIVLDRHELPLPQPIPSATLRVGLYHPVTLQRLPTYDAQGKRLPDDAISLVEIMTDAE